MHVQVLAKRNAQNFSLAIIVDGKLDDIKTVSTWNEVADVLGAIYVPSNSTIITIQPNGEPETTKKK